MLAKKVYENINDIFKPKSLSSEEINKWLPDLQENNAYIQRMKFMKEKDGFIFIHN